MFEIELLLTAEDELSEAFDWYEAKQTALGHRFYKEIDHYLSLLENNPLQFPIKYPEELRSAVLDKFPYIIIYWVDEKSRKVYITSIFHTSRNPRYPYGQ